MKCFYHSVDFDGKCSGAIVAKKHPGIELIGINYGDVFPWESIAKDELVYMVDFSLPHLEMARLDERCELVWIDHHATAINDYTANSKLFRRAPVLQVGRSACELTWEYCFPGTPTPIAVTLIGRYDVWDLEAIPGILEFQYGIRSQKDPDWIFLLRKSATPRGHVFALIEEIKEKGRLILAYVKDSNEIYAKSSSHVIDFHGLKCIAINKNLANSQLFESVYDPAKHDAMIAYGWAGKQWKVSLYSDKKNIDAGKICKRFGGGGHHGAAGFLCCDLPFKLEVV